MGEAPDVPAPEAQISWSMMAACDAEAGAAVRLGNHQADPAVLGEGLDELVGILVLAVFLQPVVEREAPREGGHFLANQLLLLGEREVHRYLLGWRAALTPSPAREG